MNKNIEKIKSGVHKIGSEMLKCTKYCPGILLDPENGVLPRCLVFENDGRGDIRKGCIIIGINPGHSSKYEREFYREKGKGYNGILNYWKNPNSKRRPISERSYYKSLRRLADEFGLTGPILWTELVKCEKIKGVRSIPLQTYRTCIRYYLNKELSLAPENWPVIAASRRVYNALAYMYPKGNIIGVPHPTGPYANKYFKHLFYKNTKLLKSVKKMFTRKMGMKFGRIFWLDGKRRGNSLKSLSE